MCSAFLLLAKMVQLSLRYKLMGRSIACAYLSLILNKHQLARCITGLQIYVQRLLMTLVFLIVLSTSPFAT